MLELLFVFLPLIVIAAIVVAVGSVRHRGPIDWAAAARRVYLYGITMVSLGMLIAGLAGLLQLFLSTVVEAIGPTPIQAGEETFREHLSFSGSLAAVGLVAWLIHWWLAQRPVRAGVAAERASVVRKLFLYLVLLIGAVMLVVAGRQTLVDLLGLAFGQLSALNVIAGDVIDPLSLLVVTGAFWLYYARVASADRAALPERDEGATLRRWFVYGTSFFSLMLLLFGAAGLLRTLWEALVGEVSATSVGTDWLRTPVADGVASVAAGLAGWYPAWVWSLRWYARTDDPDPERRSALRKVYLYAVLAVAVGWTVWNLGLLLYELLRTLLVPTRAAAGWAPLLHEAGEPLAAVAVFGVAWLYHARVLGREAADAADRRQATIRWTYGYLVALIGLLTLSTGLVGALSTLLDLALQPSAVRPSFWWQDRISLYATLTAVGLPVWLAAWLRLQREASDPVARQSLARRIYLFLVFGLAVLALLGSGAFVLFQLFRLMLGERWTAAQTSELTWAVSVAAVAGTMLAYHFRVFRAGLAPSAEPPEGEKPPPTTAALAIVRGATPEQLTDLRRRLLELAPDGVEVELVDYSSGRTSGSRT